jgi:hypothetical protein
MTTTLQVYDETNSAVLFDLNDPTGAANPQTLKTSLLHDIDLGSPASQIGSFESPGQDGGVFLQRREPMAVMSVRLILQAASTDALRDGTGQLLKALRDPGTLLYTPHGSSEPRFIDHFGAPVVSLYRGQELAGYKVNVLNQDFDGLGLTLLRQPYLRESSRSGGSNSLANSNLLVDIDANGRPDLWIWDITTGLTAESIYATSPNESYQFTLANATAHNLQQQTAAATYASGDVVTASFYARAVAVAGTPQVRPTVQFYQSNGSTAVGSLNSGTLTTLTTAWQRFTVTTSAAGALTSRATMSVQVDNVDATSVVIQIRNAQMQTAGAASAYRTGQQKVAYDPAATASNARAFVIWADGDAPAPAKVTVYADSNGLQEFWLARRASGGLATIGTPGLAQLESGSLDAETANTVDANASAGHAAVTTYATQTTAHRNSASVGGTGQTITVAAPASLAEGDVMLAGIMRADDSTVLQAPDGWKLLRNDSNTAATFTTKFRGFVYYKVATLVDTTTASYTWTVVADANGTRSYVGIIIAESGVDNVAPIDTSDALATTNSTSVTAPAITTTQANARLVQFSFGMRGSTTLTFTTPSGMTERADQQADVAYRAAEVNDVTLVAAGTSGTKVSTASSACDSIGVLIALNPSPDTIAARTTATFSTLRPGIYDAWVRVKPSAASLQRLRMEWAPMASPGTGQYVREPDQLLDSREWTEFGYVERRLGRIVVPTGTTLSGITLRFSSGLELAASVTLAWDFVYLIPADDRAGGAVAPTLLATSESLVADASLSRVLHLSTTDTLEGEGTVKGAIPTVLEPGPNAFWLIAWQDALTGSPEKGTTLGTVSTVKVDYGPRWLD